MADEKIVDRIADDVGVKVNDDAGDGVGELREIETGFSATDVANESCRRLGCQFDQAAETVGWHENPRV